VTHVKLKYVHRFYDRHGRLRFYFRRKGQRVPLTGAPGSREFMAAYQAALEGVAKLRTLNSGTPNTIAELAASWRSSASFKNLSSATQAVYCRIVDGLVSTKGDKPVRMLERRHVAKMVDDRADTPAAANRLLSVVHLMMRHAIRLQIRDDDPTENVERVRYDKKGFETWTEADIAAFETRWPLGTRARLALALLLYTAQRRSDVIRIGPQHVRDDAIEVTQGKTKERLLLPMHPELAAAIRTCVVSGHTTFLVTRKGDPFASGNAFYNWFIDCARAAGVTKSPHGLRKAAARRVAEKGGTPHHIKAMTGHRTLSEVERYTRAVEQENMARTAVTMLSGKPKD
jgi:integrase